MAKITPEIQNLFRQVRTQLGAGVTAVELEDNQLCDLLDIAIGDYMERTLNEIIDNNWISLYGKGTNISAQDLQYAMTMRPLDMSRNYSYWFSSEVGLQQRGPYELKKDFFKIEAGKQVYMVPKGRMINKVLYITPPTTDMALFANYGGIGYGVGFGGGVGMGTAYMGSMMGGFYTMQSADIAYLAADLKYKNSLLRGDLTFKVTAGPDGTHLIHLMSTPGSKFSFTNIGYVGGTYGLIGCTVWYTYYDGVNTEEDEEECRLNNVEDVILTPDQVPVANIQYAYMNDAAKQIIRQLLTAKAKELLGIIRGKFQGKVNIPRAEMAMDYQMLIQMGQKEYDAVMGRLDKRLERLRPANVMKENAELLQSQIDILSKKPMEWKLI